MAAGNGGRALARLWGGFPAFYGGKIVGTGAGHLSGDEGYMVTVVARPEDSRNSGGGDGKKRGRTKEKWREGWLFNRNLQPIR